MLKNILLVLRVAVDVDGDEVVVPFAVMMCYCCDIVISRQREASNQVCWYYSKEIGFRSMCLKLKRMDEKY